MIKQQVRELFSLSGCDSVLLRGFPHSTEPNLLHFTQNPFLEGNNFFLFLRRNRKPLLVCSVLEFELTPRCKGFPVKRVNSREEFISVLKKELKGKRIGLNLEIYPKNSLDRLKRVVKGKKFVDVSKELGKLRETKTKEEARKIHTACRKTEEVLVQVPEIARSGMKEKELMLELECLLKRNGVEQLAYPSIVASGKNSAVPHHRTNNSRIKKDSLLLVDIGGKFQGYCCDLSRTFFVGRAKEKEKEAYSKLKEIQETAIKAIKPGESSGKVFREANNSFRNFFKKDLIHALGHGIGLEVHDFPDRIGQKSNFPFKKGMVFSIEPAFYKKGWGGIRIEDNITVTSTGSKRLSISAKELIEI